MSSARASGDPHRVVILAVDDVIAFDVAAVVECLRWARSPDGAALYEVEVAAATPTVRAGVLSIGATAGLDAVARADTVVVPGRNDPAADYPDAAIDALRGAWAAGARLVSVCVGALDLARTGLLDGRRATTHWRAAGLLAARHPEVEVDPDVLWVDEGRILTSAGAASALDLCLHLVDLDHGAAVAADTARAAVMPPRRSGGQRQFIPVPHTATGVSLAATTEWMTENLGERLALETLAARLHVSERTLLRRFRDELGTTPMEWLTGVRIDRARQLLEATADPVDEIARATGLGTAANLRTRFRARTGVSPSQYRDAFRRESPGRAERGRAARR